MKFATFVLIASLCWVSVSANFITTYLIAPFMNYAKSSISCTVSEVSEILEDAKALPDFSTCEGELSKTLTKQRHGINRICADIFYVYKNICDVSLYECGKEILSKGVNLVKRVSNFLDLLKQIEAAPASSRTCLKGDYQHYENLLNKATTKVKNCFI